MRFLLLVFLSVATLPAFGQEAAPVAEGYRGIWFTLGQFSAYGDKYSGGLGTYTAKHHPLAVYAPAVDRTFFVYGGTTDAGERHLLAMVGAYDHAAGTVVRPVVVHDKEGVDDPHDNPSLAIDGGGHLWVFVSGRGNRRPGFIHRSARPYDLSAWEQVREDEFAYPQPWWVDGEGFILLMTQYTDGRELYWMTSPDGHAWTEPQKLAAGGHYQMSNARDGRVITAFNVHVPNWTVDARTNLYFAQTDDLGRTWTTVRGEHLETPLEPIDRTALVRDYRREGRLVYLKDIQFGADGHPVLLYITSGDHRPGPQMPPRMWTVARWTGERWLFHEITEATHNYDMGSLYVEADGDGAETWRLLAPTEPGPQRWGTGGEVALWTSTDRGATWTKVRDVTTGSARNHGYVRRPVGARPDFYGFWADGNPDSLSVSRLYVTDRTGTDTRVLPYTMTDSTAVPVRVTVFE